MSRYAVRTGSALALLLLALPAFAGLRCAAAQQATFVFQGKRIALTQIVERPGGTAVSIGDPGLQALLGDLGATVTYQPGNRYVLITTAEPAIISFAINDTRYDVGPISETAAFAPFEMGGRAYVPLNELLRGLDLAPKPNGNQTILQPQLAGVDLQSSAGGTKLVAHGGIPLDARIVTQGADRIVVAFDGVGSTLPASRTFDAGAVRRMDVRTQGSTAHPVTLVTLSLAPGTTHTPIGTDDQRDVTLGFDGAAAGPPVAAAQPPPAPNDGVENPQPGPTAPGPGDSTLAQQPQQAQQPPQLAQVTGVQVLSQGGSTVVKIAVDGAASFDWHRLRPPDNRWWIDVHGARLAAPSDQPMSGVVTDVRSHQEDADTVRVALSLADFQTVGVASDANGVTVTIDNQVADTDAPRSGNGTIGQDATAYTQDNAAPPGWKFGPRAPVSTYAAPNPRLIVIDPGHGGSDFGAIRGDLAEKTLTLDMSKRLRDILTARGWQVIMTRDDDRDVYAANDTAQQELQARDDIANSNGARMLISLHANSFINSGPHGTTVYYYKPGDLALAQAVDKRIASELGIYNDGVLKDKFYVINHANMPATLVETAYLSNPDDRALLASPEFRQKIAQAIADGIGDYAGPPPPATSASNQ